MERIVTKHTISFKNAFNGLRWVFSTQPNYRVHVLLSVAVCVAGYIVGLSHIEWAILAMTITVGFVIETINTALEETLDAVDRTIREDIRIAKDTAAAAMLIYAVGAVIVAAIILVPKII